MNFIFYYLEVQQNSHKLAYVLLENTINRFFPENDKDKLIKGLM